MREMCACRGPWTGLELQPWQQLGCGTRRDGRALAVSGLASPPIRAHAARREQMPCADTAATAATGVNCAIKGPRAAAASWEVRCLWLGASGVNGLVF
jgi:hypothetical protein